MQTYETYPTHRFGQFWKSHASIALFLILIFAMLPMQTAMAGNLKVAVSNYPLQYFAQRIGGDKITVSFPAPATVDPAFWRPGQSALSIYQQTDLIFVNGAGYEKWVQRTSLPIRKLVNTSKAFTAQYIYEEDAIVHSHGDAAPHSHGDTAFTTWLDFDQAILQAQAIYETLKQRQPADADLFAANWSTLLRDMRALDEQAREIVARAPDRFLIGSHPVYQYLARRYQIPMASLHWEPDMAPAAGDWRALQAIIDNNPSHSMLWEDEPLNETTRKLKEMGINSLVFSPCANVPESGDWLTVMQQNLQNLQRAYQ